MFLTNEPCNVVQGVSEHSQKINMPVLAILLHDLRAVQRNA